MTEKEQPTAKAAQVNRNSLWRPWEAGERGEHLFTLRGFRTPIAPARKKRSKKRKMLTLKEIQSPLLSV